VPERGEGGPEPPHRKRGPQFLWARIRNEPDARLPRPGEALADRKRASMELLKKQRNEAEGDRSRGKALAGPVAQGEGR